MCSTVIWGFFKCLCIALPPQMEVLRAAALERLFACVLEVIYLRENLHFQLQNSGKML